jgi:hypothetical protein
MLSKRGRGSVWLAVAGVGAVLAAGLGALFWGPAEPISRLPDGSLLTLEAVTYGQDHRCVHGNRWQRLFYPILPAGIKSQLEISAYRSAEPNTLVFWTDRRAAVPGQPLPRPYWNTRVLSFDEHGCASETGFACFQWAVGDPPAEVREGWALPAFPRRGHIVGLRILARSGTGQWFRFAEFSVPNPTSGPHPTWTPEAFPVTRQDGDLVVALTGLTTGARQDDSGRPAAAGEESWTHARFRLTQNGRPTTIWRSSGGTLADAAGNAWSPRMTARSFSQGEETFSLLGTLWPDETAWKLRARFTRTAGFRPDELWTVPSVVVPGLRKSRRLSQTATRQGASLSLCRVSGRAGAACDWRTPACVEVRMSPISDDLNLTLVRATDDRGRNITPPFATYMGEGLFSFGLLGTATPQKVSLTFAVQKPRFVEFLVKPRRF